MKISADFHQFCWQSTDIICRPSVRSNLMPESSFEVHLVSQIWPSAPPRVRKSRFYLLYVIFSSAQGRLVLNRVGWFCGNSDPQQDNQCACCSRGFHGIFKSNYQIKELAIYICKVSRGANSRHAGVQNSFLLFSTVQSFLGSWLCLFHARNGPFHNFRP